MEPSPKIVDKEEEEFVDANTYIPEYIQEGRVFVTLDEEKGEARIEKNPVLLDRTKRIYDLRNENDKEEVIAFLNSKD